MTYIYTISCAETGKVVYVGRTKNTRLRFTAHRSKPTFLLKCWMTNHTPLFHVVDSCDKKDALLMESYWIQQFKAWGFELLNVNQCNNAGFEKPILKISVKKMSERRKERQAVVSRLLTLKELLLKTA